MPAADSPVKGASQQVPGMGELGLRHPALPVDLGHRLPLPRFPLTVGTPFGRLPPESPSVEPQLTGVPRRQTAYRTDQAFGPLSRESRPERTQDRSRLRTED